jgi:hypothetical protein
MVYFNNCRTEWDAIAWRWHLAYGLVQDLQWVVSPTAPEGEVQGSRLVDVQNVPIQREHLYSSLVYSSAVALRYAPRWHTSALSLAQAMVMQWPQATQGLRDRSDVQVASTLRVRDTGWLMMRIEDNAIPPWMVHLVTILTTCPPQRPAIAPGSVDSALTWPLHYTYARIHQRLQSDIALPPQTPASAIAADPQTLNGPTSEPLAAIPWQLQQASSLEQQLFVTLVDAVDALATLSVGAQRQSTQALMTLGLPLSDRLLALDAGYAGLQQAGHPPHRLLLTAGHALLGWLLQVGLGQPRVVDL